MLKALDILIYMKASINNEDGHEDFEAMSDDELKAYLNEAIAELEEAMKPKENEWYWFYNESHPVLARLLRIENDEFIAIESDMIGNRYYKYCEPFIGKLPSFMNDIKDK